MGSKEYTSLVIAIVGVLIQFVIAYIAVRRARKLRAEALDLCERADAKRKAAVTILEFTNLWKQDLTDDQRVNLVIEWHDKLMEANVNIHFGQEGGCDE